MLRVCCTLQNDYKLDLSPSPLCGHNSHLNSLFSVCLGGKRYLMTVMTRPSRTILITLTFFMQMKCSSTNITGLHFACSAWLMKCFKRFVKICYQWDENKQWDRSGRYTIHQLCEGKNNQRNHVTSRGTYAGCSVTRDPLSTNWTDTFNTTVLQTDDFSSLQNLFIKIILYIL